MSNLMLAASLLLTFSSYSYANDFAVQAEAAYSQRDFNVDGVKMAREAVALYDQAIAAEADQTTKLSLINSKATAYYFLGTAESSKLEQKKAHEDAMAAADEVMAALNVDSAKAHELSQAEIGNLLNRLTPAQEKELADSMYTKGVSLAQWGNLNGIASSLNRLPEVRGLMERIEQLGYEFIHEYGPYRTMGRINFMLPKIFGGDLEESEKFLKQAFRKSLVEGQRYSMNGFNNIYLAETLYKRGKETQAKKILDLFIGADPATLTPGNEPENRQALETAEELAQSWN